MPPPERRPSHAPTRQPGAPSPAPPRLVVAAVIVDSLSAPTRVLAARRRRPAALAGRWEFPGGKVEPGETPTEALHRELREELDATVALGPEFTGPDPDGWSIGDGLSLRLWLAQLIEWGSRSPVGGLSALTSHLGGAASAGERAVEPGAQSGVEPGVRPGVGPGAEHDELRWLTAHTLGDVPWLDADRRIVAALALRLSTHG